MSMKRSKPRSSSATRHSAREEESPSWTKPSEPEPTWAEIESKPEEAFVPFALSSHYVKGQLIKHAKFGKGLVVGVEGARIEVLFQDGKKKLGHVA